MRFGRNMPLEVTYPQEQSMLDPSPREVSERLLNRDTFKPATSLNMPADRLFRSYKIPTTIGASVTVLSLVWIAYVGKPSETMLLVWFVVFGFFASCTAVITAHGRSLLPPQFVGRGLTLLNLSTMGGVFIMQAATGGVVGLFDAPGGAYPVNAYRAAFLCTAVVLTVCTLIYLRSHDPAREKSSG